MLREQYFVRFQVYPGWTNTASIPDNGFDRKRDALAARNKFFADHPRVGACWIEACLEESGRTLCRYGSILRREWTTYKEGEKTA